MIVSIPITDGDDKTFVACIEGVIATMVSEIKPMDLYVVRVNKWFDHKWLGYSGKGRVAYFGFPGEKVDTALGEFFQEQLTFPPFNPKQISAELHWKCLPNGTYQKAEKSRRLHKRILRSSSSNLVNYVSSFSKSGAFVWFSSNTDTNKQGSLMVYGVTGGETSGWYASLQDNNGWKVNRVKGIDQEIVQNWFPLKTKSTRLKSGRNVCGTGDYAKAHKKSFADEKQGVADAQNILKINFKRDQDDPQDYKQKMATNLKAAEQGDSDAQFNLGVMYHLGKGIPKDYQQAKAWYRKASEQGHAGAQNNLGQLYLGGLGVRRNYKQAMAWYKKAAIQGSVWAHNNLGLMYEKGWGVGQDNEQAIYWYQKATESEGRVALSYYNLARLYGRQGQHGKAIKNLDKAIKMNPEYASAYNRQAWMLATCVKGRYRDGGKAITLAKKAVELFRSANYMDTLAAAYAEAGRFEDAISTQEKVISMLRKDGKPKNIISDYEKRLSAYQDLKPWRE
jgi:TPR repeat protein